MPVTLSASSAMIDGGAREHDRVAGRAGREGDGFRDAVAVHELAAVAVDDEQRVVDADREAEHDAQDRASRTPSRRRPRSAMAPSTPIPTPSSAVTMGRPAPTSVPSMTNSTIAATTRPTASPRPTTSGIADAMDDREVDATPSTGVVVNAAMRRPWSRRRRRSGSASNITAATAALPSSDTRRTPDARSSSVAPASSLWVSRGDLRGGRVDLGLLLADRRPAGVDARLPGGELPAARVDLGLLGGDGRLGGASSSRRRAAPGRRRAWPCWRRSRPGRRPASPFAASSCAWPSTRSAFAFASCARPSAIWAAWSSRWAWVANGSTTCRDAIDLARLRDEAGDGRLLGVGERRPVERVEDDRAAPARDVREGGGEVVGDLGGLACRGS